MQADVPQAAPVPPPGGLAAAMAITPPVGTVPLLTETEVAMRLGISLRTLQRMRSDKKGPAHIAIGTRLIRYSEESLGNYLKSSSR